MYHFVVARIVRRSFRRLSQGDYRSATGLMSEKCHYHFVGYHALGGFEPLGCWRSLGQNGWLPLWL